ncbi:MAG: acyl-CoA dehydrogenase [Caldilineae bacterium]|nr:MAG: acyl-CoA dehydrogenase [Caldilineae bacterium]
MYSFETTEEQRLLIDAVNRYATRSLRKIAREAEESGELPADVIRTGWDLGLLPASIPEELGGFGEYSLLNGALYAEELGYGDLAASMHLLSPNLVAIPILLCGSEEQKRSYLPRFCGEEFPRVAAAFLEPTIFFDPDRLETRAHRAGEAWVLNGRKTMVINADEAEFFLVYAAEAPEGRTQAYLVPAESPGLNIVQRDKWMGFNALKTFTVALEDVQVPAGNRLGGDTGIDLQKILNSSRVALSALGIGVARAAYEYARDYAKERVQFGEPIAHRQSIAFMLANMAIEIDATRLLVWEAAWKLDQGRDATHEAYLAARYAADMALMVTDHAVQILGGHGYIREHPVELWLRNGRGIVNLLGSVMV